MKESKWYTTLVKWGKMFLSVVQCIQAMLHWYNSQWLAAYLHHHTWSFSPPHDQHDLCLCITFHHLPNTAPSLMLPFTHSISFHLDMNDAGNDYDSDSASQIDVSLTLPVFLSSCWAKNMLLESMTSELPTIKRQCHDSAFHKTQFLSLPSKKVRNQLKPHLTVCLIKDWKWSMSVDFVREQQWMDVLCKLNL